MPIRTCSYPRDRRYIDDLIPMVQARTGLDRNTVEMAIRGKLRNGVVEDEAVSAGARKDPIDLLKVNSKDEKLSTTEVARILGHEVKGTWDVPRDQYQKVAIFKAITISRDEVSKYIDNIRRLIPAPNAPTTIFTDHPKDKIAKALYEIYYNGEQLFENKGGSPNGVPPHEYLPLKFVLSHSYKEEDKYCEMFDKGGCFCHDADTCSVLVAPDEACFNSGVFLFQGPNREANADAPERGQLAYFPNDPAKTQMVKDWLWDKVNGGKAPVNKGIPFMNTKAIDNNLKVLGTYIKDPSKLTKDELYYATRIISVAMDYDGVVATIVTNFMTKHFEELSGVALTDEMLQEDALGARVTDFIVKGAYAFTTLSTSVRFTADTDPLWVCTMKQEIDRYFRYLVSPMARNEAEIIKYINTKLVPDFLGFAKKTNVYGDYKKQIMDAESLLTLSSNPELKALAKALGADKLYKPEELFPASKMTTFTAKVGNFLREHPKLAMDYDNSLTVFKDLLGIIYPYQKYRSQDYKIHGDAGEFGEKNGIGFWSVSPTFSRLWGENKKLKRYFPPDCLTGGK